MHAKRQLGLGQEWDSSNNGCNDSSSSSAVRPGETQEILTSAQWAAAAAWSVCRERKVSLQLRLSVSLPAGGSVGAGFSIASSLVWLVFGKR